MRLATRILNTARVAARSRVERRIPTWPAGRLERLQRWRLQRILRHAQDSVPFYREAMAERGLRPEDFRSVGDLERLPLVQSHDVRHDLERFTSPRVPPAERVAIHSSGSAARHSTTLVYWDSRSILARLAIAERDRAILARLSGRGLGQRQVFLLPDASVSLELRTWWDARIVRSERLADRLFLSPLLPMEEVVQCLAEVRPHVVFSYGSYAELFFRQARDRGLQVAGPRVWMYGGDMLTPDGRRLIEEEFGIPVYSTYQAAETGRLGFECEARTGFHLNVDLCPIRIIDAEGRALPPGETGEIVASNLQNRATVLLNYRLGDLGALAPAACPCGRTLPLLDRLEGRVSEVVTLGDGRTVTTVVLLVVLKPVLNRGALQTRILHPEPGRLLVRVVPIAGLDGAAFRRDLIAEARTGLGPETAVDVELVDELPPTAAGKARRVVRGEAAADG